MGKNNECWDNVTVIYIVPIEECGGLNNHRLRQLRLDSTHSWKGLQLADHMSKLCCIRGGTYDLDRSNLLPCLQMQFLYVDTGGFKRLLHLLDE